MTELNATALATLADAGLTPEIWTRALGYEGEWGGDVCGCPDDRCANGFHHVGADDCGCLPALLASARSDPDHWPGPELRAAIAAAAPAGTCPECQAAPDQPHDPGCPQLQGGPVWPGGER